MSFWPGSVLEALGHTAPQNDFEAMQELEAVTHHDAPASLAALRQKAERSSTLRGNLNGEAVESTTMGTPSRFCCSATWNATAVWVSQR